MVRDYVDNYTFNALKLSDDEPYMIVRCKAIELLCVNRLDIIAKYMLLLFMQKDIKSDIAFEVYKNHVDIFSEGRFYEPGSDTKRTFEDFIKEFDELFISINEDGFLPEKSIIPIGSDNVAINGGHRLAVCIFLEKDIDAIKLLNIEGPCFNYYYFEHYQMQKKHLDFLAYNYLNLTKKNIYAICIWPKATAIGRLDETEKLIEENTAIIYKKRISFNKNGLKQFTITLYSHQDWIGNADNHYIGVYGKWNECYDIADTIVYFVEGSNLDAMLGLKDRIRDIYGIDKHSVHITDTLQETITVAKSVLNPNGIHAMNYCKAEGIDIVANELKKEMPNDGREYVLNPLYTLMLYGFDVELNNERIIPVDKLERDVLYDINNYFYFRGLKFISLKYGREICGEEYESMFNTIIDMDKQPFMIVMKEKKERVTYIVKREIKVALRKMGLLENVLSIIGAFRGMKEK